MSFTKTCPCITYTFIQKNWEGYTVFLAFHPNHRLWVFCLDEAVLTYLSLNKKKISYFFYGKLSVLQLKNMGVFS